MEFPIIMESSVGQCWYNLKATYSQLLMQFMITSYIPTNQICILIYLASIVIIESLLSANVC